MAKKNSSTRKSGGAAAIRTVEDVADEDNVDVGHEANGSSFVVESAPKPKRNAKAKAEPQAEGSFGVSDVKKAAAFVNSIGGLDKAISILQILKVAKEVQ
jgi:hypothetical protein